MRLVCRQIRYLFLFNPPITHLQVLLLMVKSDQKVMALNRYFPFITASEEKTRQQVVLCHILDTD